MIQCYTIENIGWYPYSLLMKAPGILSCLLYTSDFTREINVGNSILEEENTESIEGGKTTQIIKLALWYENKCLVHDAEYLDYLIGKLEEIKNDDSDIPN